MLIGDSYLNELRNIAVNHRLFSGATMTRLKRSSVLLGSRRVKKPKPAEKLKSPDDLADLEEDDWEHEYDLLPASQIVVADDPNSYQLFGNSVFTAPQEDLLEGVCSSARKSRRSQCLCSVLSGIG